ncbi:arabinose efflux permease [Anaerolinea thermolimosa]|uniref:Arabinose efflux permease n=1 Tax=Anaerolinea thermolimosa TaxID=229919 RepID=A0A7U9KNG4_9CHLR|nr:MFS transporter [Anaerolinea thermolimosa]GAP08502.1 arabinose efflux permease [Anaerolinea thermolimosa]
MKENRIAGLSGVILLFLFIEFLDELVYGGREAAWPLIRDDLGLSYSQIGLAISLPYLAGMLIEPFLGVLGDVWRRRVLILGGGVAFTLALFWLSQGQEYFSFLLASCLLGPASGAFVSLSQASLMDVQPHRHEQNMARWTFAGSVGVTAGPLALGAAIALGLGWRGLFLVFAGVSLVALVLTWRMLSPAAPETKADEPRLSFAEGLRNALRALKRGEVVRWLVLLEFSDLMLDVLYGYLALYLVDVGGLSPETAALGVGIWTGVGLLGDFLLIPLLERVPGLAYLRVSVVLELMLFPAFLLVEPLALKFLLLGLLGFFNSGWYSVLMGHLYSAMPGQSATVMTVSNLFGWVGKLIPLGVGLAAQQWGLETAMWILLAGPAALLVGLPRGRLAQT